MAWLSAKQILEKVLLLSGRPPPTWWEKLLDYLGLS